MSPNTTISKPTATGTTTAGAPEKISPLANFSRPVLVICLFWFAMAAFVGVQGNFPLNDDWIYAEGVKHFLDTGELRLLACAPACLFHLIFGAAVCKVFGFGHETLRCVGVFWALIATLGLYGCMRELRMRQLPALLFALTFAANPMTVNLAFSFMTDTPAFSLTILYAYFCIKGMRRKSEINFVLATMALIAGSLVRQNLALMAGVNALLLLTLWCRRRNSWTLLVGMVALPIATGVLADKWMMATSDFTPLYVWYKGMVTSAVRDILRAPSKMFFPLLQIAGQLLCYVGLFCLPILIGFHRQLVGIFHPAAKPSTGRIPAQQQMSAGWFALSAAVITYALTQCVIVSKKLMPFNQNLLRIPAVGAHTILGINHANLPNRAREILTGVSGLAGFLLGALLGNGFQRAVVNGFRVCRSIVLKRPGTSGEAFEKRVRKSATALFVFVFCAMQYAFVMLQATFSDIDRYYLFPFVSTTLCLALSWRWLSVKLSKPVLVIAVAALTIYSVYSAAACQDQMAWNRARWQALTALEEQGVKPEQIDGGAEYNYYSNPQLFKNLKLWPTWYDLTHRGDPPRDQWRWWSVDREDYIVSFSPVPDFEVIDKREYWSALCGRREILTLKRLPPTGPTAH